MTRKIRNLVDLSSTMGVFGKDQQVYEIQKCRKVDNIAGDPCYESFGWLDSYQTDEMRDWYLCWAATEKIEQIHMMEKLAGVINHIVIVLPEMVISKPQTIKFMKELDKRDVVYTTASYYQEHQYYDRNEDEWKTSNSIKEVLVVYLED